MLQNMKGWAASQIIQHCSPTVTSDGHTMKTHTSEPENTSFQFLLMVLHCSDGSCMSPGDGNYVHTAGSSKAWPRCESSGGCTGSQAP